MVEKRWGGNNPKQARPKAWTRYEKNKITTTVAAAVAMGATREDLQPDQRRPLLTIGGGAAAQDMPFDDDSSDMDTQSRNAGAKRDAGQLAFAMPERS